MIFASEKCLEDFGLQRKGDIFALKAFAQKHSTQSVNTAYEERKRKLIDQLRKGKKSGPKEKKQKIDSKMANISNTVGSKATKTRKVTLGWMHSSSRGERHVTVRATQGGGTRRVDFSLDATKDDIIAEGRKLFYPDNMSPHGSAIGMFFNLANFKGIQIPANLVDEEKGSLPFTLERYINKHKLVHVRLYLTSTLVSEAFSESDDDLMPSDEEELSSIPLKSNSKPSSNIDDSKSPTMVYSSDNSDDFQSANAQSIVIPEENLDDLYSNDSWITNPVTRNSTTLIGTTDDRMKLIAEQNCAYEQALQEDKRKDEQVATMKEDLRRLEDTRAARSARVPREPAIGEPRVRVVVQHVTEGKLSRYFPSGTAAQSVYDWIGSYALEPEFFSLCEYPGRSVIGRFESIENIGRSVLYMKAAETAERYIF